jgi:hypothetical protein
MLRMSRVSNNQSFTGMLLECYWNVTGMGLLLIIRIRSCGVLHSLLLLSVRVTMTFSCKSTPDLSWVLGPSHLAGGCSYFFFPHLNRNINAKSRFVPLYHDDLLSSTCTFTICSTHAASVRYEGRCFIMLSQIAEEYR